mgnify:FL=1
MPPRTLRSSRSSHSRRFPFLSLALLAAAVTGFVVLAISFARPGFLSRRHTPTRSETAAPDWFPGDIGQQPSAFIGLILPTPQRRFLDPDWTNGVQPTVSGNPESALYGSTRKGANGLPAFHEGLDIATVNRDRNGRPTDPVVAVADGRIAYVNRVAGDSNYGLYVVLLHADPVGELYTLYAHLAEIAADVTPGRTVARGTRLGTVGHTPTSIIPLARAHLHFEIGLILHRRYASWANQQKLKNLHGLFNGGNLAGLDPLEIFHLFLEGTGTSVKDYLAAQAPAFWVVVRGGRGLPDYFQRYPSLWEGDRPPPGSALTLAFSEGGVPLRGRRATSEEENHLRRSTAAVLAVDEAILGRNGRRLILRRNGSWTLSASGTQWLNLLLFE